MIRAFGLVFCLLIVAILLSPQPADATGCRVAVRHVAVTPYVAPYVAPAVVTPYVAQTVVQAYPVYVPTYSVSYLGGSYSELEGRLRELLRTELKDQFQLENRLRALEGGGSVFPPAARPQALPKSGPGPMSRGPQGPQASGGLVAKNCSACHSEEGAKAAGTRFAFFQGGRQRALTEEELADCLEKVLAGEMPKGRTLPDGERNAVALEFLRSQPDVPPPPASK